MLQILPNEILLKIFQFLPIVTSVKNRRLVCHDWKKAVENLGLLRSQTRIRIDPFNMKEVFKTDFVQLIGELKRDMFMIKDRRKLNSILEKIYNLDLMLDNLNLSCQNGIDPRKLTNLFSNISKLTISDVTFWDNNRSTGWYQILWDILTREKLMLTSLHVNGNRKLENVDLDTFSAALCRLSECLLFQRYCHFGSQSNAVVQVEEINLFGTGLTSGQQDCIFQMIERCDTKTLVLKKLDLRSNHKIEPNIILGSCIKLLDFKVTLHKNQVTAIFDKIFETENMTLKFITLPIDEDWEPGEYPEERLAIIRNKLEICQWGNKLQLKQYAMDFV